MGLDCNWVVEHGSGVLAAGGCGGLDIIKDFCGLKITGEGVEMIAIVDLNGRVKHLTEGGRSEFSSGTIGGWDSDLCHDGKREAIGEDRGLKEWEGWSVAGTGGGGLGRLRWGRKAERGLARGGGTGVRGHGGEQRKERER
jgi:hypothetical protein